MVLLAARRADHASIVPCCAFMLAHGRFLRPPARPRGALEAASGRVRPAHPAAPLSRTLVLVEPTPGAVLLGAAHRIVQTLGADRTRRAYRLGPVLADVTLWLSLAIGSKEEHNVLTPARSVVLPAPIRPRHQDGLTAYLRHG